MPARVEGRGRLTTFADGRTRPEWYGYDTNSPIVVDTPEATS